MVFGMLPFSKPLEPIVARQFNWVWRPDASVSAAEIVCRAELLAAPTYSFGMFRTDREVGHELILDTLNIYVCIPDSNSWDLESRGKSAQSPSTAEIAPSSAKIQARQTRRRNAVTEATYDLLHGLSEFVLVAETGERRIVGVGCLSREGVGRAEFAIIVSDAWQERGVGAALLEHLIDVAQRGNVRRLIGFVLADNAPMLDLCQRLGFDFGPPEDGVIQAALGLEPPGVE